MKYHIETTTSASDWPLKILVIEFESLHTLFTRHLPEQLCEAVKVIADQTEQNSDDWWQIKATVGVDTVFTEHSLWQIVFDTQPDAKDCVIKYIDCWCQVAKANAHQFLPMHDSYHFAGEYAIFAFLQRYFDAEYFLEAAHVDLYECFIRYIKHCDLDSEFNQHVMITEIAERLRQIDKKLMSELLCYRLCNGQFSMQELSFEFIRPFVQPMSVGKGLLKQLIDYLILHSNSPHLKATDDTDGYIFRFLIAAVYGTNEKQTKEVLAYVEQSLGVTFKEAHPYSNLHLQKIMAACDAHMHFRPESNTLLDSSFHLYDLQTKKWQAYK